MINLIVNGQVLDLFKKETFAISKAVSKLGEFDLRHGDVSISFKVPSTAKNVAVFGYLSSLNNYDLSAFKRFEGEIREDESIISSGFFQVLNINNSKSEVQIRFFGGNSEWFDLIKKRDINKFYPNETIGGNHKSYSLRGFNHKFNPETIKASWNNDYTDGYFYFPIDSGADSNRATSNNFTEDDFQLGFFQHIIVKSIFDSIGIKLQGSLFNDPVYFNTMVNIPTNVSNVANIESLTKRFTPLKHLLSGSGVGNDKPINFNQQDYDEQWNGTVFTSAYDMDAISFVFDIVTEKDDLLFNVNNAELSVEVYINGVSQNYGASFTPDNGDDKLTFQRFGNEFSSTGDFPALSIGDTVEYRFQSNNFNDNTTKINIVKSSTGSGISSSMTYIMENAVANYDINLANFVKDVMFRHGAISQYNSNTRTLTINKFQDLEKNKRLAIDFSDKVDLSKPPVFDFTKVLQNFKKTSKITYSPDEEDNELVIFNKAFKQGLGDAVKEIDNDNLSGEGVIYESVFSATLQGYTFPYPVNGNNDNSKFYLPNMRYAVDPENIKDLQPRILLKAGKLDVESFNKGGYIDILFNGNYEGSMGYAYFAKQQVSLDDNSLNLNLDTLAFDNQKQSTTNYIGNTILQKNYRLYFEILKQPIHLSIYLNVNALDIQQLDFFKPIWLDFSLGRGYYYLDNVSQYKGDGTSTKFELVKI